MAFVHDKLRFSIQARVGLGRRTFSRYIFGGRGGSNVVADGYGIVQVYNPHTVGAVHLVKFCGLFHIVRLLHHPHPLSPAFMPSLIHVPPRIHGAPAATSSHLFPLCPYHARAWARPSILTASSLSSAGRQGAIASGRRRTSFIIVWECTTVSSFLLIAPACSPNS